MDGNDFLREEMQVTENGLENVLTFDMEDLRKAGVDSIEDFTSGVMDGKTDKEFNLSSKDYVKGYKYGKTGKFEVQS